jgi:hypothetical protein
MSRRTPKYPKEEFERRGEELFEQTIRAQVAGIAPEHYVAIDIDTGNFEVDADSIEASHRLIARNPDAQIWMRCVGSKVVFRVGSSIRHDAS